MFSVYIYQFYVRWKHKICMEAKNKTNITKMSNVHQWRNILCKSRISQVRKMHIFFSNQWKKRKRPVTIFRSQDLIKIQKMMKGTYAWIISTQLILRQRSQNMWWQTCMYNAITFFKVNSTMISVAITNIIFAIILFVK